MRNLYLLRGLPGSGKSTLARFVGDAFVEADMFFLKNGKYEFDGSKIRDAHAWCQSTVREWMQMNADTYGLEYSEIAVSNTFTQEWEMEAYYDLAKEFNYQVFSVSETPIPASTCTPTFDSELGIEVDTATIVVVPEVQEHSFYLMQWLRIGDSN